MKIYNTLTRQKEELVTLGAGSGAHLRVRPPRCTTTSHIGNARPLCVFDVLRRYLEWRGYEVKFVQNFTDIDDKIIRRAMEEKVGYHEIAARISRILDRRQGPGGPGSHRASQGHGEYG